MGEFAMYLPLLGGLLSVLCLWGAYRAGRRRRLVENLPTSKTTGVFIGLVELKGTAESAKPLTSYLAEQPCVHYHWSVEEHWSRTVTETYTDSEGKTQTRTRHESGWTSVADGGEMIPFYLQDDCGLVLVHPEGAKVEPARMFDETCYLADPLYYGKGPAGAVSNSDGQRRFVEMGIPQHAVLYLVGQARERQEVVAPEIAYDKNAPMFLISTRSEEQVDSGMKWGQRGWFFFGLVVMVGCTLWWAMSPESSHPPVFHAVGRRVDNDLLPWIYAAGAGIGYLVLSILVWIWMVYNSFVDLRQRVRQAWSLVDIQLKRRHDLIPNLIAIAQGCRDYEKKVQTELASLRGELGATPPGVTGPDYNAIARSVTAIAESYPELKADTAFLALQKNLSETEQRIALARGYFNDIATHYNTRLEIVPERFVAQLGAMRPQTLMSANDFERAAVKVDLG